MHHGIPVTNDICWVGVNDRETTLFESLWPLPRGVSYNAYLIDDDRTALIDSVKKIRTGPFVDTVRHRLRGRKLDYLVINHMEPDHSGSIKTLVDLFPGMRIVGNSKTMDLLANFYGITDGLHLVGDGDTLDLGRHTLRFVLTPMVHWPETMMTYDVNDRVLFSGDAFGGFGTLDGGIFDDEVDIRVYEEETRRYFSNIVGRFSAMVQKAIGKLEGLDIAVIAPTHGPIWRRNPRHIVESYARWSRHETERGVVIAYGSMYGNTEKMADFIARSLAESGLESVRVHNASKTHLSYLVNDIWRFRGLVIGSCTYNMGLFPPVRNLVEFLENSMMRGRVLGIFGTYGWSGGGVKRLVAFGSKGNWEMIEPVVEARCAAKGDDLERCALLAREMARRLGA